MILEKVYEEFGKALPDRSAYRANPPVAFREIIKKYKSWGRFLVAYSDFVSSKKKPVTEVTKGDEKIEVKKKTTVRS